ncbi:MAG: hypothetical protein DHS80DRAFT_18641 [Piptocephalis tieghemiana]|nr:MAG: hypothetical protein DHS80DRAFT_18641 [Piptocephalis tieghemiana]
MSLFSRLPRPWGLGALAAGKQLASSALRTNLLRPTSPLRAFSTSQWVRASNTNRPTRPSTTSQPRRGSGLKRYRLYERTPTAPSAYSIPFSPPAGAPKGTFTETINVKSALREDIYNSGRSVNVPNGNVDAAYGRLGRIVRDNNIRLELRRRQRYEKPNYRRRRLKSERFRRLFARVVGEKISMVMRMRKLGL